MVVGESVMRLTSEEVAVIAAAVAAYLGRSTDDVKIARVQPIPWSAPRPMSDDTLGWKLAARWERGQTEGGMRREGRNA